MAPVPAPVPQNNFSSTGSSSRSATLLGYIVASLFFTLEKYQKRLCTIKFSWIMSLKLKPEPGRSDGFGSSQILRLWNPAKAASKFRIRPTLAPLKMYNLILLEMRKMRFWCSGFSNWLRSTVCWMRGGGGYEGRGDRGWNKDINYSPNFPRKPPHKLNKSLKWSMGKVGYMSSYLIFPDPQLADGYKLSYFAKKTVKN